MTKTTDNLLEYENQYTAKGYCAICGVDEAGRGPLAGPVFAAAVVLRPGQMLEGVNDSKKLSAPKREELFEVIQAQALAWNIACASEKEIDEINILQATFLAMNRAVKGLSLVPDLVLVDGNQDPKLGLPTTTIVKGDGKSLSIAAASILAKVARDRWMLRLHERYPQYGFDRHKGYPTKLHYERIGEYGSSPVHRKTFLKKVLLP